MKKLWSISILLIGISSLATAMEVPPEKQRVELPPEMKDKIASYISIASLESSSLKDLIPKILNLRLVGGEISSVIEDLVTWKSFWKQILLEFFEKLNITPGQALPEEISDFLMLETVISDKDDKGKDKGIKQFRPKLPDHIAKPLQEAINIVPSAFYIKTKLEKEILHAEREAKGEILKKSWAKNWEKVRNIMNEGLKALDKKTLKFLPWSLIFELVGSYSALKVAKHLPKKVEYLKALKELINRAADKDILDPDEGGKALTIAARNGYLNIVKKLIENGAKVNLKSGQSGLTPLMLAVTFGHKEVVEKLLEAGANPNIRDEYGDTALSMAERRENPEIFNLLQNKIQKSE